MDAEAAGRHWAELPDDQVLDVRMCDLGLRIEGTFLERCVERLHRELEEHHLRFRPECYLGDEWFSPDGVPAIAIPFYLAHPRLVALERKMMMDVEGGDGEEDTMRFLRHECGHAICHAYRLTGRRDWRAVFGSPSMEFSDHYRFRPYSRNYVRHLENWYAQSHPEEDFAETFAVWLPGSDWAEEYREWPALKKLEYVDGLMGALAGRTPPVGRGEKTYDVRRLRRRLRTHYAERRRLYPEDSPGFFDADLRRIFGDATASGPKASAARFFRRNRRELLDTVAHWTRERKFTVDRVLRQLAARCDELGLGAPADEQRARVELAAFLSALVSNYLFTGRFKRGP
jgi:hypothetical protein